MTVTWTPPNANTYSVITYYNISYITSCSGQTISNSTTVTGSSTSVTLTDLEEGLIYTVTLTAVNELGESDPMQIVQDTDPIRKDCSIVVIILSVIVHVVPQVAVSFDSVQISTIIATTYN